MDVLLVEDTDIAASGIQVALAQQPGLTVRRTTTFAETIAQALPDVVVLDLGLPDVCRLETVRLLRQEWPEVRILVITVFIHPEVAIWSLRDGALGFVAKDIKPAALRRAVDTVAAGDLFLTPDVAAVVLGRLKGSEAPHLTDYGHLLSLCVDGLHIEAAARTIGCSRRKAEALLKQALAECDGTELTPAQLRVVIGISSGMANKQIASAVGTGIPVVERHLAVIRRRLGLPEREVRALTIWAQQIHVGCSLSAQEHLARVAQRRPQPIHTDKEPQ